MTDEFDGTLDMNDARAVKPHLFEPRVLTLDLPNDCSEDYLVVLPPRDMKVTAAGYGCVLEDKAAYSEYALVLQYTGRQDGRISWCVVLTECDGNALSESGLAREREAMDEVAAAIRRLTAHWTVQPLQVVVRRGVQRE